MIRTTFQLKFSELQYLPTLKNRTSKNETSEYRYLSKMTKLWTMFGKLNRSKNTIYWTKKNFPFFTYSEFIFLQAWCTKNRTKSLIFFFEFYIREKNYILILKFWLEKLICNFFSLFIHEKRQHISTLPWSREQLVVSPPYGLFGLVLKLLLLRIWLNHPQGPPK